MADLGCTAQGPDPMDLGLEESAGARGERLSKAQMETAPLWVDSPPLPGGQDPSAPGMPHMADGVHQLDTST